MNANPEQVLAGNTPLTTLRGGGRHSFNQAPRIQLLRPGRLRKMFDISGRQWRRYEKRARAADRLGQGAVSLQYDLTVLVARLRAREVAPPIINGSVGRVEVYLRGGHGRR